MAFCVLRNAGETPARQSVKSQDIGDRFVSAHG